MPVPPAVRDKIIESLGEHFAHDRLTIDEYERRVREAYRASNVEALNELMQDLGGQVPAPIGAAAPVARQADTQVQRPSAPKRFLALMSGVIRRGRWEVPARMRATAVMGGLELDLREATLTSPVTEIDVLAVMGAVEIIVPRGVRLESDGTAILGGFEDQLHEPDTGDPNAPVVRVRGLAVMGGVEAKVAEGDKG